MKQLIDSKKLFKNSNLLRRNKSYSEIGDYSTNEESLSFNKDESEDAITLSKNNSQISSTDSMDIPSLTYSQQGTITSHSTHDTFLAQPDPLSASPISVSSSSFSSSSTSSMYTANSVPIDEKSTKPTKTSKRKLIQQLLKNGKPHIFIPKKSSSLKNKMENTLLGEINNSVTHLTVNNKRTQNSKTCKNRKNGKNHKNNKKKHNSSDDDGPISLAILTDDGIQIKSRKPKSYEYEDYANILLPDGRTSMSSSRTSLSSDLISDTDSYMETRSTISCVTCLSDSMSQLSLDTTNTNINDYNEINKSKYYYGSVNGQIPTNAVIPYEMILNAKYIDIRSLRFSKNDAKGNNGSNSNKIEQIRNVIANNPNRHLVEISFAKPRRQDVVPKRLTLLIDDRCNTNNDDNGNGKIDIVETILQRSYKNSKRSRNILVIINPYGGKGNAKKIFMRKSKKLLMASGFTFDIRYTKYKGHGIDIAQNMDIDKYDTIACASGDGIPHEVINGLYRRPDRVEAFNKLAITQIPCGSGNAMSVSCHWTNNPSYATLFLIKSVETRCDIMRVSQPSYKEGHSILSFLSQTYGIIAESDINTEFIRWLGPARFELGVAFNILQRKRYPCDLYVKYFAKSKNDLKSHYLNEISTRRNIMYNDVNDNHMLDSNGSKSDDGGDDSIDNFITEDMFKVKYPLDQRVPSDWERVDPKLTNNLGIFYSGKMPYVAADTKFFPAALPSDGVMDMVLTDSRTSFTRMVPILLALDKGSHVLQPEVIHSKIYAYRLIPRQNEEEYGKNKDGLDSNEVEAEDDSISKNSGLFSIDGERFPLEPLQVEVIPKLCKFLLRQGKFVDTEFDIM